MATYFIDLDGVFFRYGTMVPLPGAVLSVRHLLGENHQVVFTTMRRRRGNQPRHLGLRATEKVLAGLGLSEARLVGGLSSPRVVINDEGAVAVNHIRNAPLLYQELAEVRHEVLVEQIYHGLAAIAWVSWKYKIGEDADDYVQTMQVTQSLLDCGGFDHADLVRRYRRKSGYAMNGKELPAAGVYALYPGQISKLLQSEDPLYLASDGVTDGAAMKVAGLAALYHPDLADLVKTVDQVTRVTHASGAARMSAVLIAVRFRQILLNEQPESVEQLLVRFNEALAMLDIADRDRAFFRQRVDTAAELAREESDPHTLLMQLAQAIGLEHLAWSTPITACFWSFRGTPDFKKWFRHQKEKRIRWHTRKHRRFPLPLIRHQINGQTLREDVHQADRAYLHKLGELEGYEKCRAGTWRKSIDVDTFFSIAFSLVATEQGIEGIRSEVAAAERLFGDDLKALAGTLAQTLVARRGQKTGVA